MTAEKILAAAVPESIFERASPEIQKSLEAKCTDGPVTLYVCNFEDGPVVTVEGYIHWQHFYELGEDLDLDPHPDDTRFIGVLGAAWDSKEFDFLDAVIDRAIVFVHTGCYNRVSFAQQRDRYHLIFEDYYLRHIPSSSHGVKLIHDLALHFERNTVWIPEVSNDLGINLQDALLDHALKKTERLGKGKEISNPSKQIAVITTVTALPTPATRLSIGRTN